MRKIKYAMPIINIKDDVDGRHVRRVLISYKKIKKSTFKGWSTRYFKGTKIIEKDPYFYDETKSHQYKFENEGYYLVSCNNTCAEIYDKYLPELLEKREYHIADIHFNKSDLFTASSDEEAIEIFKNRGELN